VPTKSATLKSRHRPIGYATRAAGGCPILTIRWFRVPAGRDALGKLILIVLVFAFAWWILGRYRRSLTREEPPPAAAAEDMVRCAHCGVHLPRSESRASGEKFFCSEEHLRLHR
jgi:uncharacterized protein